MKKINLFIIFILIFINFCFAKRPLSTEDTDTLGRSNWEFEFGLSCQKQIEKTFDEEIEEYTKEVYRNINLESVLKYGILENFDVGLVVPYNFIDRSLQKDIDGFKDFAIQLKYRLFDADKLPSYALGLKIKTQSANEDKNLGTGQTEFEVVNIFTKSLDKFLIHLNLGYNFLTKRKGDDDTFVYGLAIEYKLIENKFNLVCEFTGENNFEGNFDENTSGLLTGFYYRLTDWITFDIGIYTGLSEMAAEYEITSGITLTF